MNRYFRELSVAGALAVLLLVLAVIAPAFFEPQPLLRSEERRVGKECAILC